MSNVFHVPNLTNKPSRNGFDLSFKNSFTAKAGELLPIMHRSTLPGDKFKIQIQHRTVTLPLETSAFTRFTEYFDFFFVPYDQFYRQAPRILTEMQNNPQIAQSITSPLPFSTTLPWFSPTSLFGQNADGQPAPLFTYLYNSSVKSPDYQGFNEGLNSLKLWNYLGGSYVDESLVKTPVSYLPSTVGVEGYPANRPYSIFPFAAYQKIYFDHYRFEQWENNAPQCYNFDYLTGTNELTIGMLRQQDLHNNIFTLRHCNWPKDLFFGMLPSPQYGDAAKVISSAWAVNVNNPASGIPSPGSSIIGLAVDGDGKTPLGVNTDMGTDGSEETPVDLGFSILQLRQSKALQRYREVIGTGNQDYKSMVKKVWGVDVPAYTSHTVRYLGGFSNVINVNTIINNNLGTDDSQPTMKGFAEGVDEESKPINFEADEHGILMCIYRVVPLIDYALKAPHFDMLKTDVDDFANPFFDRLGLQELPSFYLSDKAFADSRTMGYVPRYFDYKTSVDVVNGALRTDFSHWISAFNESFFSKYFSSSDGPSINKDFFKVNSHILDSVFFSEVDSSVNSDQFIINSNISLKAVRNLDYDGLPKGN